ncbi:hypothetical protein LZG74_16995 [Dyadobacter sp. CY327]|uniref:hypothetical protein n=1 Tax=Dyadobacter sp. CY327 TaxID=2907301 RepID=UPI001F4511FE|nr:hypothetical protein [Dyadobacter sp. CY327]MCE7072016.1 hypothetical protein [Dyadobacter sp. CY327]
MANSIVYHLNITASGDPTIVLQDLRNYNSLSKFFFNSNLEREDEDPRSQFLAIGNEFSFDGKLYKVNDIQINIWDYKYTSTQMENAEVFVNVYVHEI